MPSHNAVKEGMKILKSVRQHPQVENIAEAVSNVATGQTTKCPFLHDTAGKLSSAAAADAPATTFNPKGIAAETPYTKIFEESVQQVKNEGRYRVFQKIQRMVGSYPKAHWYDPQNDTSKEVTVWCSNDYLAQGQNPRVVAAAKAAIDEFGAGAGGTRNIGGNTRAVCELESALAQWHNKESALVFSSGYVANEAALSTLAHILPHTIFFSDEENHASMIRGMLNAKGASKRVFRHNDVAHLRELLEAARLNHPTSSLVIAFESVYSMSGTIAPIVEIVEAAKEYGALTYLDEVHAVGMYGYRGSGVAEELGVAQHVDIIQGTLGKAVGSFGGYIAGNNTILDAIRCNAPGFIFTTALPPAVSAAATESVRQLSGPEGVEQRGKFRQTYKYVKQVFAEHGLPVLPGDSHIVPLLVMDSDLCKQASDMLLRDHNHYVQPINYPTVPRGRERLRITPGPVHTMEMCDDLLESVKCVWKRLKLPLHHSYMSINPSGRCPVMTKRTLEEQQKKQFEAAVKSDLSSTSATTTSSSLNESRKPVA
eukprot:PhM_4_TR14018/c0_g1_i2/m.64208/K00643/E2.3.1.37, ALAS; 5-aminolevulinate synthase